MLVDLFGYLKRNTHKWNAVQIKKCLVEINQIQSYLERKLKEKEGVA